MHTLVTAPMYHSAPNAQALFALALGIELTVMPRFEPEEFLRLVSEQAITHAQTVPTMFVRLLELPGEVRARYDLGSLECVVHAAAPCPAHVKRRIIDWFGPVIREYYGATEIGVVIVCDSEEWLAHEGTVGHTFAGSDIHVHDADGRLLGPGETGEIFIRPPDYWPGFTYLGQDDKRREIERDGYISIGDVGSVDADGYLYLSDRARDMVISGGVNIYPAEIEACLLELGGVRDVAVFGIPDDSFGEALAAHVDAEPWPASPRAPCVSTSGPGWPATRCRRWSSSTPTCPARSRARSSSAASASPTGRRRGATSEGAVTPGRNRSAGPL